MLYKITSAIVIIFTLTSCGGGGSSSNTTPEQSTVVPKSSGGGNTAPSARIEKITSTLEGMTVELNASKSYDKDGDKLTFNWKQKSGTKVIIVNPTTPNPSFIAPDVNEDSNVEFELSLSDGKSTAKAKIVVNIIDQIKVDKRHEVIPTASLVNSINGVVNISYRYNKNPKDEVTSGLVLNIYWDSSVLEFSKITEKLTTDFMGISSIKDDYDDKDSSTSTDKYITISWVNLENGKWKIPAILPTSLFDLEMKEINFPSNTTQINIKTSVDSPGLSFYSSSVLVSLGK